jgi:large subunit ribosomal protein L9
MPKELILIEDVPGLGFEGDMVKVADGYARNFLLPKNLAAPVSAISKRQLGARIAAREERFHTLKEHAEKLVGKLADASITIPVKAGPEGKLFGSVSTADIAKMLAEQGTDVDRHMVQLKEPLRELGVYDVTLKLHPNVETKLKVWIVEE